jgi:putative membrane protein
MKTFLIAIMTLSMLHSGAALAANEMKDSEILAYLVAIDVHEISAAQTALNKKTSTQIADFARKLRDDHRKHRTDTFKVARETHTKVAKADAGVLAFRAKVATERGLLMPFTGERYETEFINALIKDHQDVLERINNDFLPNAHSDRLKMHLEATKVMVENHLDKARDLQNTRAGT